MEKKSLRQDDDSSSMLHTDEDFEEEEIIQENIKETQIYSKKMSSVKEEDEKGDTSLD